MNIPTSDEHVRKQFKNGNLDALPETKFKQRKMKKITRRNSLLALAR